MEGWTFDFPEWICHAVVAWAVTTSLNTGLSHFRRICQRREAQDSNSREES